MKNNIIKMCIVLIIGIACKAYAGECGSYEDGYSDEVIERVVYEYTTDIDTLLNFGQKITCYNNDGQESNIQVKITDSGNLMAKQIVSAEYYEDDSYSEEYAITSIGLYEYSEETRSIENRNYTTNWNKYDIATSVTAYYRRYYRESGIENGTVISRLEFRYTKGGSNYAVNMVQMYSHGLHNIVTEPNIERYATYKNPNPLTVYTLNTDDTRIYNSSYACRFNLGAVVTLSDGTVSGEYDLMILLEQIEAVW